MNRAGTGDCGEGESPPFGALSTRRTPEAGRRSLEAGGERAVGGEAGEASPPVVRQSTWMRLRMVGNSSFRSASTPIFMVMIDDGQVEQEPTSFT